MVREIIQTLFFPSLPRNISLCPPTMQAEGTPAIHAVIVSDSKGRRIAAKYFPTTQQTQFRTLAEQHNFEKKLYQKTRNSQARFEGRYFMSLG